MPPIRKVLLLDDDDADIFVHRRVIQRTGLVDEIAEARSVDEAIAYLRENADSAPDLIFVDINMPYKDGWAFLAEYEELPEACRTSAVIVMLTSSRSQAERDRASSLSQLSDYCTKPLTEERFKELAAQLLPS